MKENKIYINNSDFMEYIDELATQITEERFGDEATKEIQDGLSDGTAIVFTDDAQDFYNDMYDEYEGLTNSMLGVYPESEKEFAEGGSVFSEGKEGRYHISGQKLSGLEPPVFYGSVDKKSDIKEALKQAERYFNNLDSEESFEIFIDDIKGKEDIDPYAKGGEIASAIFSPNSKKGKISTSFGDKTKEGLTAMIENDSYSAKEIANAIFEFNEKRDKVKTNYGDKTKEGLIAMIESARDSYAKGGSTKELIISDRVEKMADDLAEQIEDENRPIDQYDVDLFTHRIMKDNNLDLKNKSHIKQAEKVAYDLVYDIKYGAKGGLFAEGGKLEEYNFGYVAPRKITIKGKKYNIFSHPKNMTFSNDERLEVVKKLKEKGFEVKSRNIAPYGSKEKMWQLLVKKSYAKGGLTQVDKPPYYMVSLINWNKNINRVSGRFRTEDEAKQKAEKLKLKYKERPDFKVEITFYDDNYNKKKVDYAKGGLYKTSNTINKFGMLSFSDIDRAFGVDLFELSEDEQEEELDGLREDWQNMEEEERMSILEDLGYDEDFAKGGNIKNMKEFNWRIHCIQEELKNIKNPPKDYDILRGLYDINIASDMSDDECLDWTCGGKKIWNWRNSCGCISWRLCRL